MPPLSLLIKPASGLCQYRCKYCFYADVCAHREKNESSVMTEETLESLVRRGLSYGERFVTFSFQGGEPTLAGLDFFRTLIKLEKKYQKDIQVQNAIQTNGGLIDDEWAKFLAENHFLVGLSMDGNEEDHDAYRVDAAGKGTYAQTRHAAELFQKYGVEFNILCVVNKTVASHAKETYEALKQYGYLQFIPCIDGFDDDTHFAPDAEELGQFLVDIFDLYERDIRAGNYVSVRAFDNYIQILRGRRPENCAMMGRCSCYFVIDADGTTYPCDFYCLDEWKLGNILENSFSEMLASQKAKEFVSSSVYMNAECKTCSYYGLCRGGCRRDREPFDEYGRPSLNKYCAGYKLFFSQRGARLRALAQMA